TRTPISRVRAATWYAVMPYKPTDASTRAIPANARSSTIGVRRGASVPLSTSDSARTPSSGSASSMSRTTDRTAGTRDSGSPDARTTSSADPHGSCLDDSYAMGAAGASAPASRVSPTTPTIVRQAADSSGPSLILEPMASPSGKYLRASASFTITTLGASPTSPGPNTRPRINGMPMAPK